MAAARSGKAIRDRQLARPVALNAAASTSERVAFQIVNRKTGNHVRHVFGRCRDRRAVERDNQAQGCKTDRGKKIVVGEKELAEAVPGERQDATR